MKKLYVLILSVLCLCASSALANSPCDSEMKSWGWHPWKMANKSNCQKPCKKACSIPCQTPAPCESQCPQTYTNPCAVDGFLCTNKDKACIYREIGLSETQICTADKIQDKYELEVMSLNEKIKCEQQNLSDLAKNCASAGDKRRVNRNIKDLKKERKDICKCYEKQFEAILSDDQRHAYRRAKKN